MARWEPNARGRLEEAALDLYLERGYEQVTVAEIAARAGLTERTFYRHFADKREVLFDGSAQFVATIVEAVADAPHGATALGAVGAGLHAAGTLFDGRQERVRRRQAVIAASPELTERELIKLATLVEAVAAALQDRGEDKSTAQLAAEVGGAVFRRAFERWVAEPDGRPLTEVLDELLATLRRLSSG